MMHDRRIFSISMLGCCLLAPLALIAGASAQDSYPSRTITLLVPFPPGGSADTVIRPVAQKVAEASSRPS